MIVQLTANLPKLVHNFGAAIVTIYVRDYGAGNLRLGMSREDLQVTTTLPPGGIVDGIAQAAAAGFQMYFWSGELWMISDQNDGVVVIAPAFQFFINRGVNSQPTAATVPLPAGSNLNTVGAGS